MIPPSEVSPRVSQYYSTMISWAKDCFDQVIRSTYFENKDNEYCLKLCDKINENVKELFELKKAIESYFYEPPIEDKSPSASLYSSFNALNSMEEEELPKELLNSEKAQNFTDEYDEFSKLLDKVAKDELNLNKYVDGNHNITDELWAKSSPFRCKIVELKYFQNEKRAYRKNLDINPSEKNIQIAMSSCIHKTSEGALAIRSYSRSIFPYVRNMSHGVSLISKDFYNYLATKTQSKIGAWAIITFGLYGTYKVYYFVRSDYTQIATQLLFWSTTVFAAYQVTKLFRSNAVDLASTKVNFQLTASTENGSPIEIG